MADTAFHARLRQAVGRRTYRAVSDLTGVNAETVRRYLQGQAPSVAFTSALCEALGINAHWLLTGEGPMSAADRRADSLRDAKPAELLGAIAAALESLSDRVDRIERYTQSLDARLRALGDDDPDGGGTTDDEPRRARAKRIADAVPERSRQDAR